MLRCAAFLAIVGCLGAAPAVAGDRILLSYRLYYGGLAVADIASTVDLAGDGYRIEGEGRSLGLLDLVFPITVRNEGTGRIVDGTVLPVKYESRGRFRGEDRLTSLRHVADAPPKLELLPPPDPERRDPVPPELQRGALDPYAALATVALRPAAHQPCDGVLPVFTGQVRSDLRLAGGAEVELPRTDYSAYHGPARLCEVTYETLAGGYKKSWWGKGREREPTKVWVARLDENGPWLPVRVEGIGPLGATVIGHLTAVAGGTEIAARLAPIR